MKAFYTAYLQNDWENIIKYHLMNLKKSKLLNELEELKIHFYPYNKKIFSIIEQFNDKKNIKLIQEDNNYYEFPALIDMIENYSDYNLYFHSKGSSKSMIEDYNTYFQDMYWNQYMTYFNIYKWKTALNKLKNDNGDTIGVSQMGFQYSGNFFWTTGKHLQDLKNQNKLDGIFKNNNYRFAAENFICSIPNKKYLSLSQIYWWNNGAKPTMNDLINLLSLTTKSMIESNINMKNRTDIINKLIKKYKYENYLEIGVSYGENFNQIICKNKIGVDPDKNSKATIKISSDDFFKNNKIKFDLIFIDGLHHSDQVYKDIKNALNILNPNGMIVLHDCKPEKENEQTYNQCTYNWNGDCWKAFVRYRYESPYECFVVNIDWGCGIIDTHVKTSKELKQFINTDEEMFALTWQNFIDNKNEWFNLISVEEFTEKYDLD